MHAHQLGDTHTLCSVCMDSNHLFSNINFLSRSLFIGARKLCLYPIYTHYITHSINLSKEKEMKTLHCLLIINFVRFVFSFSFLYMVVHVDLVSYSRIEAWGNRLCCLLMQKLHKLRSLTRAILIFAPFSPWKFMSMMRPS